MRRLHRLGTLALTLAGSSALCLAPAMAAKDHFNRSELGAKWVVTSGTFDIANDQLQGSSGAIGYYKKSAKDDTVSATVYSTSSDLEYGAVVSGDIAGGNDAFVKIQGTSGFQYGAFYTGNNGGGDYFQLDSSVPSPAKLTVSFCGTTATMTIKSSAGTQKYTYDYGTTFGNGGGLGTYGEIALDNYRSKSGQNCGADAGARRITQSDAVDPTRAQ